MSKAIAKRPEPDFVATEEGILEAQPETLDIKDLVVQDENGQVVTDSLKVAEVFGKRHDNVVRDIKALLVSKSVQEKMKEGLLNFQEANYTDRQGKSRTMYRLDREAFSLVTFGFTGEKALKFKLDYISAFKAMEERLSKPAAPASQLEVLLGAVNGLVAQDKRLKELEDKTAQADEKTQAIEEKVAELDRVFKTNGCERGFVPLTGARGIYGESIRDGIDNNSGLL